MDATVTDRCASVFDWARFRRTKGPVKLHLLLDHDGLLPRYAVITDEQAADSVRAPIAVGYVINVDSYKNGVGYGKWLHIDGWSEAVIEYIREYEPHDWVN